MPNNDHDKNHHSLSTFVAIVVAITVQHGVTSRMADQPLWLALLLGAAAAAIAAGRAIWIVQRLKRP